jgi:hypothetical protein
VKAQLLLYETGVEYLIDFESTIQGVNESAFLGNGIRNTPLLGELDSDAWKMKGCSEGNTEFSNDYPIGDYARGLSNGSETTGGIYSFQNNLINHTLGWQSTSSDLSPGSITLKIQNQSGFSLERVAISYRTWLLNDQNRSQRLELFYSIDDLNYNPIPFSSLISNGLANNTPLWIDSLFSFTITTSVANQEFLYLQWRIDDYSGSGSRDEWAIDDITIQITNNTCIYEAFELINNPTILKSNEGFTLIGINSFYESPSNYGNHSPSARFDDDQDQLITTTVNNPFSLKFWMKSFGNSSGSSLAIDGFNGSTWSSIANYSSISGSGTLYNLDNLSGYTQFKFTYTKTNGNIAIDDISISCGACNLDQEASPPTGFITFSSTYCNQSTISWPSAGAEYYLVLATEKTSITSIPQDQYSYKSNSSMKQGEEMEDSVYVVYNGALTQFTLNQLQSGRDYLIYVFPYNGLVCEENYSPLSISASLSTPDCSNCPFLISALINPCEEECGQEGKNELLFFNSASFSLPIDTNHFKIIYKGQNDNLLNEEMIANPTLIYDLNALNPCATLFIDALSLPTIPNNSTILVCNSLICLNDIDPAILCFSPVIYVLSCVSSEWNSNGEFINGGFSSQQFSLDFSGVENNCVINYSYTPNDIPQSDGSYIQFSPLGGAAISHSVEADCNSSLNPLPLTWGSFTLSKLTKGVQIEWTTLSELNNQGFYIERSKSSLNFENINWFESQGNSSIGFSYSLVDNEAPYGLIYYRIKQIDFDGQTAYSNIQSINNNSIMDVYQNKNSLIIKGGMDKYYMLNIYSMEGLLVYSTELEYLNSYYHLGFLHLEKGLYIISLVSDTDQFRKKIFWK